jgi:hypothetical protein
MPNLGNSHITNNFQKQTYPNPTTIAITNQKLQSCNLPFNVPTIEKLWFQEEYTYIKVMCTTVPVYHLYLYIQPAIHRYNRTVPLLSHFQWTVLGENNCTCATFLDEP